MALRQPTADGGGVWDSRTGSCRHVRQDARRVVLYLLDNLLDLLGRDAGRTSGIRLEHQQESDHGNEDWKPRPATAMPAGELNQLLDLAK